MGDADHICGSGRTKRHARHDDDPVSLISEALAARIFAGATDHVLDIDGVARFKGMHAPDQSKPTRRIPFWRQGENGRLRALARDPQLAAVAQLGAAACLERFGALDEALAAVDAADLPDALRSSRDRTLRERTSAP